MSSSSSLTPTSLQTSSSKLIASEHTWIEGQALQQLQQTAKLPYMVHVAGMPDLHPGKGTPIGVGCLSQSAFYPHLVGNDIGCGIGLWKPN